MFRHIILFTALVVAALLLSGAGCGATIVEPSPVPDTRPTITVEQSTATTDALPTETPMPAPTDTGSPAASRSQPGIGDTSESSGLKITINEVRHEDTGNL